MRVVRRSNNKICNYDRRSWRISCLSDSRSYIYQQTEGEMSLSSKIKLQQECDDFYYQSEKFLARVLVNVFSFVDECRVDRISNHCSSSQPVKFELRIHGWANEHQLLEAKELGFVLIKIESYCLKQGVTTLTFKFEGEFEMRDLKPTHSRWLGKPEFASGMTVTPLGGSLG